VAEVPWKPLKFASNSKLLAGQCLGTSAKSIKTLPLVESWLLDRIDQGEVVGDRGGFQ
jgi:hypothetical protein